MMYKNGHFLIGLFINTEMNAMTQHILVNIRTVSFNGGDIILKHREK